MKKQKQKTKNKNKNKRFLINQRNFPGKTQRQEGFFIRIRKRAIKEHKVAKKRASLSTLPISSLLHPN